VTFEKTIYNELCGDQITLSLKVDDGVIEDAAFQGTGCAISRASASMMTGSVLGKPVAEAEALFRRVRAMLTGAPNGGAAVTGDVGKLAVFAGVREFPGRIKCATLAWHTLQAALAGAAEPVSTEQKEGEWLTRRPSSAG
jgi:nitrogen fixation protein NifU and related proteins